jgi:hypothetical protein
VVVSLLENDGLDCIIFINMISTAVTSVHSGAEKRRLQKPGTPMPGGHMRQQRMRPLTVARLHCFLVKLS